LRNYEKHFNVSADVATQNLATQLMGVGLSSDLTQDYGDAFTDNWFANSAGDWVVDITADVPTAGLDTVLTREGIEGSTQVDRVDYTHSDEVNTSNDLATALHALIMAGEVQVGYGAGQVQVKIASGVSDADRNTIDGQASIVAALPDSPPVSVVTSPDTTLAATNDAACAETVWEGDFSEDGCDTPIPGMLYSGDTYGCTLGWYGWVDTGVVTVPVYLTAGHCALGMGGDGSDVYATTVNYPSSGDYAPSEYIGVTYYSGLVNNCQAALA
jgi:hypothetical protein